MEIKVKAIGKVIKKPYSTKQTTPVEIIGIISEVTENYIYILRVDSHECLKIFKTDIIDFKATKSLSKEARDILKKLLEVKQRREEEILAKEQEVLELKRKYFGQNGEWFKKREALLKPIQDEIYTAIQDIANEKRYDVVKDRSAEPSLIYMSSKLDISDQVLEKLGAK